MNNEAEGRGLGAGGRGSETLLQPPASSPQPNRSLARLRWRCRRGMRELDVLLLDYLDRVYPGAGPGQQQAFERLLELQDPELLGYIIGRADLPADGGLRDVLASLTAARG